MQLNQDLTLTDETIQWLLESNSYTAYVTRRDLLDEDKDSLSVAREKVVEDPKVQELLASCADWLPLAAGRNNDPKLSYFTLRTLADFGLTCDDRGIKEIVVEAEKHWEDESYAVRGGHPERPKRGEKYVKPDPEADVWHSAPCNSPVITSALLALGHKSEKLDRAVATLAKKWDSKEGWFCHYHFVNSMYKKHNAGCPMAGLMALEVFSQVPDLKESVVAQNAFAPLEFHREFGKTLYYFGRSNKFWTFKYPFVWYNALYLGEVLTRFDFLKGDPLVQQIITWIEESSGEEGRLKPTSMFMPYKSWDFGNKKESSPWITLLCSRILKRWYAA